MQVSIIESTVRVCNSHMVFIPAIWIGWCRQSAVNMLSCESTAAERRAFVSTPAPRMASILWGDPIENNSPWFSVVLSSTCCIQFELCTLRTPKGPVCVQATKKSGSKIPLLSLQEKECCCDQMFVVLVAWINNWNVGDPLEEFLVFPRALHRDYSISWKLS